MTNCGSRPKFWPPRVSGMPKALTPERRVRFPKGIWRGVDTQFGTACA